MKLRSVSVGLIAGSVAVFTLWLTRAVLPPREAALPEVIRLDTLRDYADRPSRATEDLLAHANLLDQVVPSYSVAGVSVEQALGALGDAARVNIVVAWERVDPEAFRRKFPVTLSLQSKTVGEILEMIFAPPYPETVSSVGWFVRGGVVYVTDEYGPAGNSPRVYDVRDLMAQAAQISAAFNPSTQQTRDGEHAALGTEAGAIDRLISLVGTDLMPVNGGSDIDSIHYFAGRLLIDATRKGHRQVEERLQLLRERK